MEGSQLEISGCAGQPRSEGNQEPRIKDLDPKLFTQELNVALVTSMNSG